MNETPVPPPVEALPQAESSLFSRLTDVFVTPSRVFEELKTARSNTANWLVPMLLACIVGIVATWVMFSQDTLVNSVRDAQRTQLQKQVDAGKMTQDQADKAAEMAEKFISPGMLKVFGSVGAVFGNVAMLFVVALIIWLLGTKVFDGEFGFMRAVEASGLASMITVLGGLVTMLLVVIQGRMTASLSPALFLHEPNLANPAHRALAAFNIITLWYVGVLAVALARLSGGSVAKSAIWMFGIWAVLTFGSIAGGMAFAPH